MMDTVRHSSHEIVRQWREFQTACKSNNGRTTDVSRQHAWWTLPRTRQCSLFGRERRVFTARKIPSDSRTRGNTDETCSAEVARDGRRGPLPRMHFNVHARTWPTGSVIPVMVVTFKLPLDNTRGFSVAINVLFLYVYPSGRSTTI